MNKLIPFLFVILGAAVGIGAGITFSPEPEPEPDCIEETCEGAKGKDASHDDKGTSSEAMEYVKLNNQFVVPVIADRLVQSLIVVSLSIEIEKRHSETVYAVEPKLRDQFLQVLFDFAHIGGFDGSFANSSNLDRLKRDLTLTAQEILGAEANGVLITDIVRQDV